MIPLISIVTKNRGQLVILYVAVRKIARMHSSGDVGVNTTVGVSNVFVPISLSAMI